MPRACSTKGWSGKGGRIVGGWAAGCLGTGGLGKTPLMKNTLSMQLVSVLALALSACASDAATQPAKSGATGPNATAAAANMSAAPSTYGAPITPGDKAELAAVLTGPDAHAGKTVIVEGAVRQACTKKGCWMELATAPTGEALGCRVTFKDYGFFVPLDSAGAKARVQGVIEVRTVPADQVKHLEGEGAQFTNKLPDGSAKEVRIVATGVEMWREAAAL